MTQVCPSEIVNKICKEAENFDSKDRLLNFSTKGDFQTPLLLEAGDLFYEKWLKSGAPLPFETFLPLSQSFTAQQKMETTEQFAKVIKCKAEDFLCADLYLLMGFLKWDGNALAPSILIPLDIAPDMKSLSISPRGPIENVILRQRLKDIVQLPRTEDATINGKFSILLYFSLFEKAIAAEKKWKFTRHGISLAFFNTNRMLLKKRLERGFSEKKTDASPFLKGLLGDEGFRFKESVFEEADFDQVFNPTDYYFLYPTDSHTTKVTIDALDEASAYAVQALPGTSKIKVAANIVAESVAKKKRTLVVARRSISKQSICDAIHPKFRSFNGPERDIIAKDLRKTRDEFSSYYKIVNKTSPTGDGSLADILQEFRDNPPTKAKFPDSIFKGVADLPYNRYKAIKETLEELVKLYFEQDGINARKTFEKIMAPSLDQDAKEKVARELETATKLSNELKPLIDTFQEMNLFPTGAYLATLSDLLEIIQKSFSTDTPDFERWDLRSNNWIAYKDTLLGLPEAGDKWVRYRRQTSDIYTDDAVDQNVLSAREEFAASLKVKLKGLSDHYRNSRKVLIKAIRNPKSITSDTQLLDFIDTLIDLQDNKRAYRDSSVLGAHLLGKDWLYEKSNWIDLNNKITFVYNFREIHKNDPHLDYLLLILENWHHIKQFLPDMGKFIESVQKLTEAIRGISKELNLDTPLEGLSIEKWLDEIRSWNDNWNLLDIHVKTTVLLQNLESSECKGLAEYAKNSNTGCKDLVQAFAQCWTRNQIQLLTKKCPDLFSLPPKERALKGKAFQTQLDQFSNANFRAVHAAIEADPELLRIAALDETYNMDNQVYDVAVILDADCISVTEAFSTICIANKVILIGDPHMPTLEPQPFDAFTNILPRQSAFFLESILASALRKGIPTRELWFTTSYNDISLVNFANAKIYNYGIKQLPMPNRKKSNSETLKVVPDKVMAIAKTAIQHAEKHPGQTLGIIAFHQARCFEIEAAIRALIAKDSPAARYFDQPNPTIRYYVKTPDRAVDKYRDVLLVCIEIEGNDKISAERKLALCSTLARQELQVFVSKEEVEKHNIPKANLFWEWISYLEKKELPEPPEVQHEESPLCPQVQELLQQENISFETQFAPGGIAVGPVVVDANNSRRFLAVVEDDCTTERFRESVEDREYIRPTLLRQLGWKVIHLWLPFWYMSEKDEKDHLITTIAIEQSVAPPPVEDTTEADLEVAEEPASDVSTVQYAVVHPKIEGTPHDKPIAELPAAAIISQLKFYVDHESPIHEELLLHRLLELHHVDRAGPMILKALKDAIKLGFQNQKFIKTGKFFYSTKNPPVALRNRSTRPDLERKLQYVAPEERALLSATMDERAIKMTLGLLE